jgi:hypothetical protein
MSDQPPRRSLARRIVGKLARLVRGAPPPPPPPPEKRNKHLWAIGLYEGPSPLALGPMAGVKQPLIVREDVTDVRTAFVGDPFLVPHAGAWWLFFELFNLDRGKGEIGVARSDDLRTWRYERVVLRQDVHLSYPFVFEWEGVHYMVPETHESRDVRLFRATDFPWAWEPVATLLSDGVFADSTLLHRDGRWWLFVDASPKMRHETLRLYSSDSLTGPYVEHPQSPLHQGAPSSARPAGRMVEHDGRLLRFAQDCVPHYGMRVRAFEVARLDMTGYEEREVAFERPLDGTGAGWNEAGMHHVDAHRLPDGRWVASVDGWRWASRREQMREG